MFIVEPKKVVIITEVQGKVESIYCTVFHAIKNKSLRYIQFDMKSNQILELKWSRL